MAPSIPIPTDNIYKFCCLFGLALIISSVFSFVSIYNASLDRKVQLNDLIIELQAKAERTPADESKLQVNKKLVEIVKSNESTGSTAAGLLGVFGLLLSGGGAYMWFTKIQLRDDKMAELQLAKLEAEVKKLQAELAASPGAQVQEPAAGAAKGSIPPPTAGDEGAA
jgi:hypothetical protein